MKRSILPLGLILFAAHVWSIDRVRADVVFSECELSLRGTAVSRKLECADMDLPLFIGSEERIRVSIVRLKAQAKKAKPDPVLMLAGGPGQAASEAYLFADRQFHKLNWDRDIYLIDQRGTGRSTLFTCEEMSRHMTDVELMAPSEQSDNLGRTLAESCLSAFDYDARYFTTSAALLDFEAARIALGITQWNVLGVSYGTRVAQHYLRQYPDSIRSVVLDSVVYAQHKLGTEIALQSQLALERVFSRCTADDACRNTFPQLAKRTNALLERLKVEDIPVVYEDIRTGSQVELSFSYGHVALVLRMSLYSDESAALVPLLLKEAYANNNFAPLARKADSLGDKLNDMMALGMHNAVVCSEDVPHYSGDEVWRKTLSDTYMGEHFTDMLVDLCRHWPVGLVDEGFKQPLKTDKPVLLFSGEEDPITPPSYAERAREYMTNALHVVAKGQAHHVSTSGCAPTLVAKFVDELNPRMLDTRCMERLKPAPFFIDFNGPRP